MICTSERNPDGIENKVPLEAVGLVPVPILDCESDAHSDRGRSNVVHGVHPDEGDCEGVEASDSGDGRLLVGDTADVGDV